MKRSCPENYRFNSDKNQKIKREFVNREVNENQTGFIEECFNKEVFNRADITNDSEPEDQDKHDRLQKLMTALDNALECTFNKDGAVNTSAEVAIQAKKELIQEQIDNLETTSKEIFEWYSVSEWFAKKLEAQGEAIISYGDFNYWWGRTCSGQAILLDGVISEICWKMGILEGQESEWAV